MTAKLEALFNKFKRLMSISLAGNEHLVLPSFHNLLSVFVKNNFLFGGTPVNARISMFLLQESGTGKGVNQQHLNRLIGLCGKKSNITQDFTTAGIIGTIGHDEKGKVVCTNKPLQELQWLGIDEGSFFMGNTNQHITGFINALNHYLDVGSVCKMLAKGKLEYDGKAVLNLGSFIDGSVKETFLHSGFFQRFWITHKVYTDEQASELRQKMDLLSLSGNERNKERDRLQQELKKMLEKVERFDNKNYAFDENLANYYGTNFEILVKKNDAEDLRPDLRNLYRTSLARAKKLGYKVMVHYATVNQQEELNKETINYALNCVKLHLDSFLDVLYLFNNQPEGAAETSKSNDASHQLLLMCRAEKKFSRTQFINDLKHKYMIHASQQKCDAIIKDFVRQGKLSEEHGINNAKTYTYIETP